MGAAATGLLSMGCDEPPQNSKCDFTEEQLASSGVCGGVSGTSLAVMSKS